MQPCPHSADPGSSWRLHLGRILCCQCQRQCPQAGNMPEFPQLTCLWQQMWRGRGQSQAKPALFRSSGLQVVKHVSLSPMHSDCLSWSGAHACVTASGAGHPSKAELHIIPLPLCRFWSFSDVSRGRSMHPTSRSARPTVRLHCAVSLQTTCFCSHSKLVKQGAGCSGAVRCAMHPHCGDVPVPTLRPAGLPKPAAGHHLASS